MSTTASNWLNFHGMLFATWAGHMFWMLWLMAKAANQLMLTGPRGTLADTSHRVAGTRTFFKEPAHRRFPVRLYILTAAVIVLTSAMPFALGSISGP